MKLPYIEAGEIVTTHGVRGEVKVLSWLDSPEMLCEFDRCRISGREYVMDSVRVQKTCNLVKLRGVDTMEDAQKLRGKTMELYREDISDELIFASELVDVEVYADGACIGKIKEVLDYPGNSVYVVQGEREYLIPAVKEFILSTDLERNQMQVKLLRFLQEKTFSRVGSNRELHADVRFIAATSRNLEELMAANKFREDLYYRLNIFPIVMPDLSKRKGDVMLLAEHFLSKFNLKYGKDIKRLSTPAINMLMAYHWPGNVRELENCMERAVITAQDDCIYGYNLPASLQMPSHDVPYSRDGEAPADLPTMVDSFERELIVAALKRSPGNMSAAARELGISPRVLHYKMHRLGLQKS